MDLPVTGFLTLAPAGVKWLAKQSTAPGGEKHLVFDIAEGLVSSILGNRADAAAANWLARMKQLWLRVDIDPNHDLLRTASMASWLASYRLGLEYGFRQNLRTEHWSTACGWGRACVPGCASRAPRHLRCFVKAMPSG
ncbi:MAG: hypothetical protein JNL62_26925 [Bryobacterales bacterium]|nr:hypothetical protein [Bryobacterales bacterium]